VLSYWRYITLVSEASRSVKSPAAQRYPYLF
jgi:hypothetical protein